MTGTGALAIHPVRRFAQHTGLDREPSGSGSDRTPQHAGLLESGVSGMFLVRVSGNEAKGNGPAVMGRPTKWSFNGVVLRLA